MADAAGQAGCDQRRLRREGLAARALERARERGPGAREDFYAKHFSFRFDEVMNMGAMGDYCFIDHAGVRLGAVMQKPAESPIDTWLFYFGVDSVAAAKRAIEAAGGQGDDGPAPGAGR